MKKLFFLCLLFLLTNNVKTLAQDTENTDEIFTIVEEMPYFPGGESELKKFILDNLKYPESARKAKISGVVYIQFVVDTSGNITRVKVLKGIGTELDESAVAVVKSFPKWMPGKQNGRTVAVVYNLPIRFSLN